jgi:hypothetical protein
MILELTASQMRRTHFQRLKVEMKGDHSQGLRILHLHSKKRGSQQSTKIMIITEMGTWNMGGQKPLNRIHIQ